jgi:hypothetical protein
MIISNPYRRIAFLGGMVALLLAVLSAASVVAYTNGSSQQAAPQYGGTQSITASESPASLTKAYPLNTGPLRKPGTASGTTRAATSKPRAATSKTHAATGVALPPEAHTNSFWPVLVLGVGVLLILFVFWVEVDGWQVLRLRNRPGRALNLALGSRVRPSRRLTSRNRRRTANWALLRQEPHDASGTVPKGRRPQKAIDMIGEDRPMAPTSPASGRSKIIDPGQPAPYSPRFGRQDPRAGSRVGQEDRASDDRPDRQIENRDTGQTLAEGEDKLNKETKVRL